MAARRAQLAAALIAGEALPFLLSGYANQFSTLQIGKTGKVVGVAGDQGQVVHLCNRGDLAIRVGRRAPPRGQSGALPGMPECSFAIVWKNRRELAQNPVQVTGQLLLARPFRQTGQPVVQFVQDRSRGADLVAMRSQA